jgi:hypothetical protein
MTKKDWTAELARLKEVKQRLENGSTLEQERELEVREL